MSLFGKVVVSVRNDEGKVFTGIGYLGWKKPFKWNEVNRVREEWNRQSKSIILEGADRLSFGTDLTEKRQYFLLQALKILLNKRKALR